MTERIHEIVQDASRWAKEAWIEWSESIKDSPPAHFYTLLVGGILMAVTRWVV